MKELIVWVKKIYQRVCKMYSGCQYEYQWWSNELLEGERLKILPRNDKFPWIRKDAKVVHDNFPTEHDS